MRCFWALFKREIKFYFTSPVAYVVLVIFAILGGWFNSVGFMIPFSDYSEQYPIMKMQPEQNPMMAQFQPPPIPPNYNEMILPALFGTFSIVLIFVIPLLTMRTIAEEKREGTIELLYTYPVSDLQVVLAKYFSVLAVFGVIVLLTAFYIRLPDYFGGELGSVVDWGAAFSGLLGFFLLGATAIALGMMFSAMTENQVVAGALTFSLLLLMWIAGWAAQQESLGEGFVRDLVSAVSLTERSNGLYGGLIHLSDIVYFVCVTTGALFITMRLIESHRWRA